MRKVGSESKVSEGEDENKIRNNRLQNKNKGVCEQRRIKN